MSNVYLFPSNKRHVVIDEAYMEQFSDDQLAYLAWELADLVQDYLVASDNGDMSHGEAAFDTFQAALAMRVLFRRLTGIEASLIQKSLIDRQLAALGKSDTEDRP